MLHSSSIAEVVIGRFWTGKSRRETYKALIQPGQYKLDDSRQWGEGTYTEMQYLQPLVLVTYYLSSSR